MLNGKSLLAYSIEAAIDSKMFETVMVSMAYKSRALNLLCTKIDGFLDLDKKMEKMNDDGIL